MAKKGYKKCFIDGNFYPKDEMYLTLDGWLCEACYCDQWDGICPNCKHENAQAVKYCQECKREFYRFP